MAKIKRKTVEVGTLLYRLNYFLEHDQQSKDERDVLTQFVTGILHDTGNYEGFRYTDGADGVVDDTRRFYFVSSKIREDYDATKELVAKHYYGRGI